MKEAKDRTKDMEQEIKKHPDYPEEYITGKVTFFGREFIVTPDVLIPRLETEWLVRRAIKILKNEKYDRVVDIGCGSGIIATSVADLADEVVFLDISHEALEVAEQNFRTHFPEKKAEFVVSDLLDELPLQREYREAGRDLITVKKSSVTSWQLLYKGASRILLLANLPYIKWDDWVNMSPDTRHEPELALFGWDETGFEMYERLFSQMAHSIKLWNSETTKLIIEFWFDQREIAEEVIVKYGWEYEFFADYAWVERFAEIIIPTIR
jgi:release factor glutamine methyltransferase